MHTPFLPVECSQQAAEMPGYRMQAWTTHMDAHLPHKLLSMRAVPSVHNGFLKSWRANDLNKKVLEMVETIMKSPHIDEEHVKIYITGMLSWLAADLEHSHPS